jgi:antirestriction protein ArdC
MARRQLTDEERAAKQEEQRLLVAKSIEALRTSDGWRRWLRTRKAFRRYSFGNTLLIAVQCPHATHVAGFKRWLSLGYCVRKGEPGLYIWAPVPPSKAKLAAWEAAGRRRDAKPRTHFRLIAVFDRSQVAELPPPAEPATLDPPIAPVTGDDLADRLPALVALAGSIGSTVSFDAIPSAAEGYYQPSTKAIVIEADLAPNARAATLIHELAHALVRADHHDSDPSLDYAAEEVVAETVAFMAADTLGLDTSAASIPYLATWAEEDAAVLERTAALIDRLARRIEDAILLAEDDVPGFPEHTAVQSLASGTAGTVQRAPDDSGEMVVDWDSGPSPTRIGVGSVRSAVEATA